MPLRPELAEIDRLLADARATAEATLNGMTEAQLNWSPSRDRWSAAMIADHLVRSNEGAAPKIAEVVRNAPATNGEPLGKFGFFERFFIKAMSPGSRFKMPVPPMFEPEPPTDAKAAVAGFFQAHEALAALVPLANAKRLDGLKVTSPVSPLAKFRVHTYLHALAQHERYHLEQVKALIEEPGFPR
ncbi:MAG: DinB family protein [Fimbriimonas sp.]